MYEISTIGKIYRHTLETLFTLNFINTNYCFLILKQIIIPSHSLVKYIYISSNIKYIMTAMYVYDHANEL